MEKEKVNDAVLHVELQEEEVEKVSRASALWFTATHRPAAQLGFHTLHESRSCPGRGIRGHIEEPCPRAARIPVPNLLSRSALQLLAQKIAEAHRIELEHQARLQDVLQNLEQLKQQQQQRLHQGSVPSAQDLGAPSNGPSSAMAELSRVLWVGRDVLGRSTQSAVPLTAAAPWAPVPDVPPLVETPPRHRFRDIGEVMAVADRALLSAQVQTLRFHIQKVRQGESGAERGCGAAGGSWAG